jgi:hypothetical protein
MFQAPNILLFLCNSLEKQGREMWLSRACAQSLGFDPQHHQKKKKIITTKPEVGEGIEVLV